MEIERKFLVKQLPDNLQTYPHKEFEQGYLCTKPVLRVRREGDEYVFTYKGSGMMARDEVNKPLTKAAYEHLIQKVDGNVITKTRYVLPEKDGLYIELDVFHGVFQGLVLAEVEFPSEEDANAYQPPAWFGEDVTFSPFYHNSFLSKIKVSNSIEDK